MRVITILLLIGLVASAAAAQNNYSFALPKFFHADHINFDKLNGVVEATGSVEVALAGDRIRADYFRADLQHGLATAEGNVQFSGEDFTVSTDYISYNISTETFTLPKINAQYIPPDQQGKIYFSAKNISLSKKHIYSGQGTLTTCGNAYPHYHVQTSSVDYREGENFSGGSAVIYVGDLPVFWLPYLAFNFTRTDKRDLEVGYNQVEGNYAKSSWGLGKIRFLLDYMSSKGWGYGTDIKSQPAGLYFYHLYERDTGTSDWIEKVEFQRQITPASKEKFTQSYISSYQIPAGRLEQSAVDYTLSDAGSAETWKMNVNGLSDRVVLDERYSVLMNRSLNERTTDYSYNYEYSLGDVKWMRASSRYSNRLPLIPDRLYLSGNFDYFHNVNQLGDSGEEKVEPQLELIGNEPNYTWRLTSNWLVDLRENLYPGTTHYEFLQKQPEAEVAINAVDLNYFILQPTIGLGSYRESHFVPGTNANRDFSAQRYRATFDLFKPFSVGLGTDVLLGVGIDQYLYSTRDKLYAYREAATIQSDLGLFFRNTIAYRKGYTRGNSPFFFDRLGTGFHDIYDTMVFYYLNKFAWSFEGGHNWQTGKWFDLMTRMLISPSEKFNWSIDAGWDIENQRYKDLATTIALAPVSYFSVEASMLDDPNTGTFKSASTTFQLTLLENEPNQAYIMVNQGYDPINNQLRVRDIMLVKDLHCWQMKFAYSEYMKQFSVTFSLKGMPGEPFNPIESLMRGYTK